MTVFKTIVLLVILFSASFLLSGCLSDSKISGKTTKTSNSSILKVGVSTNAPPLIFKNNGKIIGLEASLAQKLATFLHKEIEFVEVPWEKQIEYLNQGKTDIVMSGMTITKTRNYLAHFSKPYLRSGQIMLVRLKDRQKFSTGIVSLLNTNYRIGTIKGTTGDLLVTSTINGANEISFKTSTDAVNALIRNKIDALVYDAPMVCHYAAQHQTDQIVPVLTMATEEYLGWAMRKNDHELITGTDNFLQTITSTGELKQEINNWIPYLSR